MGNQSAKHQSSSARPKKNVHWKTAEIPSPPGKPVLVHSDDTDSDAVTLRWERPRTDGGSPLYGYYVEHRRTGSPQWVNSTPALILYPEVVLTGLEPGWRYQFRVTAENAVGTSAPSELSDPLTVALQRNAIATAPHFISELPAIQTVIENEKVEFQVAVGGQPAPQVNWYKDGFEVFSSRRTRIVTETGTSTLIIHQTALTDEGEIKCTATNRLGHVVARAALHIEAPPKIRLPRQYEDGLLIEADEVVRLKVGLAGRPAPMVVWCHNGEIIRNDGDDKRYEVQTTEKNSTLKITNSRRADRGEYNLRAINKLGDDVVSFLVTVTDRPSRPGKVTVAMSLGKSVTLSWQAPEDDGGCKIGNYVVEYFRLGWNVWLKAVTTRQLSATLSDLIEGSEYKFRVKAESPYGMSDPSDESDVMFVPDPKRGILSASMSSDGGEQLQQQLGSRIPVLTKPPVGTLPKEKITTTTTTATTLSSPVAKKRMISPKVFDSETIAREMSYGTRNSSDIMNAGQKDISAKQQQQRQQQEKLDKQLLDDNQQRKLNDASNGKEPRKSSLRRDAPAAPVKRPQQQLRPIEQTDVHTSSEFVLVLHDDHGKKKDSQTEPTSYDPEFESIPPPPLSHSTPELGNEHPIAPKLRRCVSSTEMLYEKAMQRFYRAVEQEAEDKTAAKQQQKPNPETGKPHAHDLPVLSRRLGSFGEADLLERRNSLRKRVSTESLTLPSKLRDKQLPIHEPATFEEEATTSHATGPAAQLDSDAHSIISDEPRDLKHEIRESQRRISEHIEQLTPSSSVDFEDDYTESTASSASMTSVDSMEKFKSVIQAISKAPSAEMDTYNPMMSSRTVVAATSNVRTIPVTAAPQPKAASPTPLDHFDSDEMIRRSLESTEPEELLSEEEMEESSLARQPADHDVHDDDNEDIQRTPTTSTTRPDEARALSPYRTPAPDQSTISLTRPLPLPSPDFVPKPILKRPSIEDVAPKKDADKASKSKSKKEKPEKPEKSPKPEKDERKSGGGGLLQMFKKSSSSAASTDSATNGKTAVTATTNAGSMADAATTKMSAAALAKKKSMERRQSSLEENKVAIDHYSDIVKAVGVQHRPRVPVYLSVDELKRVAERDALEAATAASGSSTGSLSMQTSISSTTSSAQKPSSIPVVKSVKPTTEAEKSAAATAAANLKQADKRSIFSIKLSKDPKKVSLEALPKPPLEFSRSVSTEDTPASSPTPPTVADPTKRNSLQRGRPSVSDASTASSPKGTRSRSSSLLRKGASTGSRDSSQTRAPAQRQRSASREPSLGPASPSPTPRSGARTRTPSRQRSQQSQSKSPTGRKRTLHVARIGISVDADDDRSEPMQRSQTPEQLLDEAEQNVRSTMTYAMDVTLLLVASWVYMFKNVWLVLPILALLVYRQVSTAVADKIPKWMKRKRSGSDSATAEAAEAQQDD